MTSSAASAAGARAVEPPVRGHCWAGFQGSSPATCPSVAPPGVLVACARSPAGPSEPAWSWLARACRQGMRTKRAAAVHGPAPPRECPDRWSAEQLFWRSLELSEEASEAWTSHDELCWQARLARTMRWLGLRWFMAECVEHLRQYVSASVAALVCSLLWMEGGDRRRWLPAPRPGVRPEEVFDWGFRTDRYIDGLCDSALECYYDASGEPIFIGLTGTWRSNSPWIMRTLSATMSAQPGVCTLRACRTSTASSPSEHDHDWKMTSLPLARTCSSGRGGGAARQPASVGTSPAHAAGYPSAGLAQTCCDVCQRKPSCSLTRPAPPPPPPHSRPPPLLPPALPLSPSSSS